MTGRLSMSERDTVVIERVSTTSTSDGGGAAPGNGGGRFEAQLANDGRSKSALHRLVLILPLTLLIFLQALLHPDAKIKLPLVELELEVREVLPVFLVLNAFMLYRAVRYARIVLWRLFQLPGRGEETPTPILP